MFYIISLLQVDWWSLGCVLYEMTSGHPPFGDSDRTPKFEIFNNILNSSVSIPMFMSSSLAELIRGLLEKEPEKRMDWTRVKMSSWLSNISWTDFLDKKIAPPWRPPMTHDPSRNNFVEWKQSDVELPSSATPDVSLPAFTIFKDIVYAIKG